MTELAVEECDFSFDDPDTCSLESDDVNITHCDTPPPIVEFEDDFGACDLENHGTGPDTGTITSISTQGM